MTFEEINMMNATLLDSIVDLLSYGDKKGYRTKQETPDIFKHIKDRASIESCCVYLPLVMIISLRLSNKKWREILQISILKRATNSPDIKQSFEFFVNSYRHVPDIGKMLQNTNMAKMFAKIDSSINNKDDGKDLDDSKDDNKDDELSVPVSTSQSGWALFGSILSKKLSAGSEIRLHSNSMLRDPINYEGPPLSRIKIREIIESNSSHKPLLLDCYVRVVGNNNGMEYLSSTIILKQGDDLRCDNAILSTFRYMNKIWRDSKLRYKNAVPVEILTYKCVAMGADYGVLESVPGCIRLRLIDVLNDDINAIRQYNLVASAAASYIASFVMGIRDRHFDNVLIRKSDFTLFHIEFGRHFFGQKASLDTSKLAITPELKNLIGIYWDEFVELGCNAYMELRIRSNQFIKFACVTFAYLVDNKQVKKFLEEQLHVNDMSDEQARKYIEKKLREAPDSFRTKFKNVVHRVATIKK